MTTALLAEYDKCFCNYIQSFEDFSELLSDIVPLRMFFFLDERRRVSAVKKSSPNIKTVQKILKMLCSFIAPYLEKSNEKICSVR